MKELTSAELRYWQSQQKSFRLIDVREPFEHEHFNIGGSLVPLGNLMAAAADLPHEEPVVFYCEKGIRSAIAIQRLEAQGFDNLFNLKGGIKAWRASGEGER